MPINESLHSYLLSLDQRTPNPQGKGQVMVMADLHKAQIGVPIRQKSLTQISNEWFTSLFVLSSECRFEAVPDQMYHLYRMDGRYRLLMLGPEDWAAGQPGDHLAQCRLHRDLTWSLELSEAALQDEALLKEIEIQKCTFERDLQESDSLEEALPYFVESMDYHQRVLAYGLAKSLKASMELDGIAALSFAEAQKALGSGV